MSNEIKPFAWAQGTNANVKEPIEALKQHGWRYGDVPAASNFNWLFKQMGEEIVTLRKELAMHNDAIEKNKARIANLSETLATVQEKDKKFRKNVKELFITIFEHDKCNTDYVRMICDGLRFMEKNILHYHPGFPESEWPLQPVKSPTAEATENIIDDMDLD